MDYANYFIKMGLLPSLNLDATKAEIEASVKDVKVGDFVCFMDWHGKHVIKVTTITDLGRVEGYEDAECQDYKGFCVNSLYSNVVKIK